MEPLTAVGFVGIVSAVVVSVAEPVRLDAASGIGRQGARVAGSARTADAVAGRFRAAQLVLSSVAVLIPVAHPRLWYARALGRIPLGAFRTAVAAVVVVSALLQKRDKSSAKRATRTTRRKRVKGEQTEQKGNNGSIIKEKATSIDPSPPETFAGHVSDGEHDAGTIIDRHAPKFRDEHHPAPLGRISPNFVFTARHLHTNYVPFVFQFQTNLTIFLLNFIFKILGA